MKLVIWVVFGIVVVVAASTALYFSKLPKSHNPGSTSATATAEMPSAEGGSNGEDGANRRPPAATPSPQEQYRRALVEEDEMKRTPTWEEMHKEAPAEF